MSIHPSRSSINFFEWGWFLPVQAYEFGFPRARDSGQCWGRTKTQGLLIGFKGSRALWAARGTEETPRPSSGLLFGSSDSFEKQICLVLLILFRVRILPGAWSVFFNVCGNKYCIDLFQIYSVSSNQLGLAFVCLFVCLFNWFCLYQDSWTRYQLQIPAGWGGKNSIPHPQLF